MVRPEAVRGALTYILSATQEWSHTIQISNLKKKVTTLRIVVCTGILLAICAVLIMMRAHGLHGGAHHMLATLPGDIRYWIRAGTCIIGFHPYTTLRQTDNILSDYTLKTLEYGA